MQPEIEVRFLDISYDALRQKLRAAGASQTHPMRHMRRVIIDFPDQRLEHGVAGTWSFIRLRDEGDQISLTYKQIAKNERRDAHEIEIQVSSFDNTLAILRQIGLEVVSEQHTRRETWQLKECTVTLDEWPWLPPMVELEGPSEEALQTIAKQLALDWATLLRGNAMDVYQKQYPRMKRDNFSIRDIPLLTFETMPEQLKAWRE